MFMDKETKAAVKEATEKIIWEAKKKKELLNTNIDYNFLQELINKCNDNPDLAITIYFKSGDRMVLQTKYQEEHHDYNGWNGNPTAEEIK